MQICEKEKCTGCSACIHVCPQGAVQMCADEEGFFYPQIDQEQCVNCRKCLHVCPQREERTDKPALWEKKVFACWHKSKRLLRESTSGGAFSALSYAVLSEGGVVYGAGLDTDQKVIHKRISSKEKLTELRGSKYVQSEIGTVYAQARKDLEAGIPVLFSGTPCQVDALYHCLGKRYEGLLTTVDLVCHGVPSPMIYGEYLRYMTQKYHSPISKIYFRNKKPGWYVFGMKIVFQSGEIYENDTCHDPYIRGFLRNYFLRPSCHHCAYTNTDRPADITLADDWGYRETGFRDRDNDQGISMVMLHTENGFRLFEKAKKDLKVFPRTVEAAVKGNPCLRGSFPASALREEFWRDYRELPFSEVLDKYCYAEDIPEWMEKRVENLKARRRARYRDRVLRKILGQNQYERMKSILKSLLKL